MVTRLLARLDLWMERTHDQGLTPAPESRSDANMNAYQGRKPNAEVAQNITLMRQ